MSDSVERINLYKSLQVRHMEITCEVGQGDNTVQTNAMIDSGATSCFIDNAFCGNMGFELIQKRKPITVEVIDGREISSGAITHEARLRLRYADQTEEATFDVTKLGHNNLVLGLPWLERTNPQIDWSTKSVHRAEGTTTTSDTIDESSRPADKKNTATGVPDYCRKFVHLFEKGAAESLPPHRPYDCKIDLKPGAELKHKPVYPMSERESEVLHAYIQEELRKGFIRPSKSPISSSMFFVKKKDGTLRPVVDYRYLNSITIKNRYPLPLMMEIVERLGGSKYFTKLDLRTGYNLVRIAEGDEWKTAFTCKYGLYEYLVMPFGLCNAPAVFQHLMNDIFRHLFMEGIMIYLDDILIHNNSITRVKELTLEVLRILDKYDLYVKPEKCE